MTSRRSFIQKAGALAGATLVPGLSGAALDRANPDSFSESIRSQLLVPEGRIYLNTGSLGPSPRKVLDEVVNAMWTLEKDPVSENWGRLGEAMESVRKKVADFIHADKENILLTRNTTARPNKVGSPPLSRTTTECCRAAQCNARRAIRCIVCNH